jgi:c-di-GMP-binding flagellar brake protein YcgR
VSRSATGASGSEKRAFRRVAAGAPVVIRIADVDRRSRRYLQGVAANLSLGGMRLMGGRTFHPGTVIELEFALTGPGGETLAIRARAVVRWRRRFARPRRMGVEFVDFEGLGREHLRTWFERLFGEPGV